MEHLWKSMNWFVSLTRAVELLPTLRWKKDEIGAKKFTIPSHDIIGCGLAFLDDIICFVILSWVCHSKKLTPQLGTILHHMQWHPPWRSFLPAGTATPSLLGIRRSSFLKPNCAPKNPDPSKVPILRTRTPALQVQTLPLEGPRIHWSTWMLPLQHNDFNRSDWTVSLWR